MSIDSTILSAIEPFVEAGFAVHWLKPRSKAPIGAEWQNAPVATLADLTRTYAPGNNVGLRLGDFPLVSGDYAHVFDIDIRVAELADEAWEAFARLFPNVSRESLPEVVSGSGGESRHLHFVSDKPFRSKKLATSAGKHRGADAKWHYDWEIELFGTGKQVAMPPSIHPDTGQPYRWARGYDFDELTFGGGPKIASEAIESLGVVEDQVYAFETRDPLDFKPGQLEADLDMIEVSDLDYDDWVRLGQALHHQFGGSQEGFDLWLKHTRRSKKFTGDAQVREMRRIKWRSFGKYRGQPVTMGTVRAWAQERRVAALADEFEDLDDDLDGDSETEDDFDEIAAAPSVSDDWDGGKLSEEETKLNWMSLLDTLEDGKGWRPTLHNVELIIRNDPRLVGVPRLNEFTQETVQRTTPGIKGKKRANQAKPTRELGGRVWQVKDTLNGEIWSSARDYAVRSILEAPRTQGGYGMQVTDRNLKAAIVLAAWDNSFHPVREYLSGLAWDGVNRVESLFTDYLGAEDISYTRDVARLMMIAAVARVFEPGHKWDFAVILEGLQGRGKSTFIRTLGKRWFAELDGDFHDGKEMVEKMQGAWIMEIPELSGFNRTDVRSIKAFISRQTDKVRLAYEARATEFPRQCILIGSTNDKEYLKDDTGGRRFFPMECHVDMIDIAALRTNVDQLWAEAFVIYRAMRDAQPEGDLPLYLDDAISAAEAARLQESRRVESADDAMVGRIEAFLDRPVTSGDFDNEEEGGIRNITCLVEVWAGLGNDPRAYKGNEAQALGRSMSRVPGWKATGRLHNFPLPFGRQRFYERLGSLGIYEPVGPKPSK